MTCAELEILLCDYVDGTLHGERKSAVEQHLAECADCAELARDAATAVAFMQRAALVEPPQELVTRILFQIPDGKKGSLRKQSALRRFAARWLEPVLQPRLVMGMAMTMLSLAMLMQFSGIRVRQLRASDLDPVKIWSGMEERAHRTWERGVKYYDSLKLVFEIQSRLKEWNDQADADRSAETPRQTGQPAKAGSPAPAQRETK